MVSVLSYRHRNEQYRGEPLESYDRVAIRILETVDRLGSHLLLESQVLPGDNPPCSEDCGVCWCWDSFPPITRVTSMPPCGEREKPLELVGAEGQIWFISTNSSLSCFRIRRPWSPQLQEMVRLPNLLLFRI